VPPVAHARTVRCGRVPCACALTRDGWVRAFCAICGVAWRPLAARSIVDPSQQVVAVAIVSPAPSVRWSDGKPSALLLCSIWNLLWAGRARCCGCGCCRFARSWPLLSDCALWREQRTWGDVDMDSGGQALGPCLFVSRMELHGSGARTGAGRAGRRRDALSGAGARRVPVSPAVR